MWRCISACVGCIREIEVGKDGRMQQTSISTIIVTECIEHMPRLGPPLPFQPGAAAACLPRILEGKSPVGLAQSSVDREKDMTAQVSTNAKSMASLLNRGVVVLGLALICFASQPCVCFTGTGPIFKQLGLASRSASHISTCQRRNSVRREEPRGAFAKRWECALGYWVNREQGD